MFIILVIDERLKPFNSTTIPVIIGKEPINIKIGILNRNMPILFSISLIKQAQTTINFLNDTINSFGANNLLTTTNSGHYAIPQTQAKQLIKNLERSSA